MISLSSSRFGVDGANESCGVTMFTLQGVLIDKSVYSNGFFVEPFVWLLWFCGIGKTLYGGTFAGVVGLAHARTHIHNTNSII